MASFRSHGIAYERCEKSKSDLYLALVATTNARGIELPDDKRLVNELRRLERKRGRAGRDTVDHPPRLHDDLANSVAGVSYLLGNSKSQSRSEFNASLHVVKGNLRIVPGDWPLLVGLSCSDSIAASVVGQVYGNEIRIHAAFCSEGISLRHHLTEYTRPWLSANCPRLQLLGGYEDNPDVDIRAKMHQAAVEILGGQWILIWHKWDVRVEQMRDILTKAQPYTFRPVVQISPVNTAVLSQALTNGRFYDKAQAKTENRNYHVANAFSLVIARSDLWKSQPRNPKPLRIPPSAMSA